MEQVIPCGSYDIVLGTTLLSSSFIAQDILRKLPNTSTFVILTDTNVYPLYAMPLYQQLQLLLTQHNVAHGGNKRVLVHAVPAGESSKCREMKAKIEDEVFFHNRCHRDTCVIAVGGGVVGDLSGYVAATYMRGVPFIQVPTSLLACVDSSIGGKTGIDIDEYGKNLLGAFHMPERVYIDLSVLKTLPKRELINGMGEIIKAGAIFDAALFDLLEISTDEILTLSDMELVQQVVAAAVQVKATVVTQDTKEMGLRAILNFGHSIGHGIEALVQPEYLHGECVSIGMIKEAEIARGMGLCSSATVGRLRRCLTSYGLPVRMPEGIKTHDILVKMEVDKKNSQGIKKIILLESIGKVLSNPYVRAIADDQIALVLEKQVALVPGVQAKGRVRVPGSKSISNRVLLMAALGKGTCRLTGLLHSDDTQVMMNALQKLGAVFAWEQNGAVLVVEGTSGKFTDVQDMEEIYLSNAGTAARFLTTTMTLVSANKGAGRVVVTGNARMKERPLAPLVEALQANGCDIQYLESDGCPPIAVKHTGLKGGVIPLAAKVSSQYVSSVLLSAPYACEPVELLLDEENPTSLPYIEMTTQLMDQFGIEVETIADNHYKIPCGVYQNPAEFSIEVDASSATYPLALAAITGGTVTVEALGEESLQGDAGFYSLCEKMGCEVSQDETTTTVTGPQDGKNLQAIEIDMEEMTDAFMTAVALAAVAEGTTKITGIANQRVKECNRIDAMVTGLRKLGIESGELVDGIWIKGVGGDFKNLKKAFIECHNDHRIAMSFAVLGAVVPNVVITDKECTDKTYPEFWDHLGQFLGLRVTPVAETEQDSEVKQTLPPALFLIGMRGAGKTSLAKAAAHALDMELLDTDEEISKLLGESIRQYLARPDVTWEKFRALERRIVLPLLAHPPPNTIISCGGGVVESEEIGQALEKYPFVIHVNRDIHDVLKQLEEGAEKEAHRPSLGEPNEKVWERRLPLFTKASSYEFTISKSDFEVDQIANDFVRFVKVILPRVQNGFDYKTLANAKNTFFLSLTFPDLHKARDLLPQVTKDVDALEVRVDLLQSFTDFEFIKSQIAFLRRVCPDLPVIYTVRSQNQGGEFPDTDADQMFELLKLGVRLGCEFIDMETCWPLEKRRELISAKRHAAIISSFHAVQSRANEDQLKTIFNECFTNGKVQIVKVVTKAFEPQDALLVDKVAKHFAQNVWKNEMPVISLATTEKGKMARVLNQVLTPVTHKLLPAAAAPGQLSVKEIMALRKQLGLLEGRSFYLFGSPISKSPSPSMHNAAFQVHDLPFTYGLCDTSDVLEIVSKMENDCDFGGGSITIPLKVDIMAHVDELTQAAKEIGAVNTLTREDLVDGRGLKKRFWRGDNTDWLGILRPIQKRLLEADQDITKPLIALVVGAGGTSMAAAYAMKQLGVAQLFVYNRTLEKAQQVAQRFQAQALSELTPETLPCVDIVISTIPSQAEFTLPSYLLQGPQKRVIVLDAAYMPPITPCLASANAQGAVCIQGYEMLYEQAYEQYTRWHKATEVHDVDVDVFKQACLAHIPEDQRLY